MSTPACAALNRTRVRAPKQRPADRLFLFVTRRVNHHHPRRHYAKAGRKMRLGPSTHDTIVSGPVTLIGSYRSFPCVAPLRIGARTRSLAGHIRIQAEKLLIVFQRVIAGVKRSEEYQRCDETEDGYHSCAWLMLLSSDSKRFSTAHKGLWFLFLIAMNCYPPGTNCFELGPACPSKCFGRIGLSGERKRAELLLRNIGRIVLGGDSTEHFLRLCEHRLRRREPDAVEQCIRRQHFLWLLDAVGQRVDGQS
jgi:hypothetical protein